MIRSTREWDIRCPRSLTRLFPVRAGYYYKVDREQAQKIVRTLAKCYAVPVPFIASKLPPKGCNGMYDPRICTIYIHGRGHIKTVFHEFYHHLDDMTDGRYSSSDRQGGDTSLAWQFADRLFEVFRKQR